MYYYHKPFDLAQISYPAINQETEELFEFDDL